MQNNNWLARNAKNVRSTYDRRSRRFDTTVKTKCSCCFFFPIILLKWPWSSEQSRVAFPIWFPKRHDVHLCFAIIESAVYRKRVYDPVYVRYQVHTLQIKFESRNSNGSDANFDAGKIFNGITGLMSAGYHLPFLYDTSRRTVQGGLLFDFFFKYSKLLSLQLLFFFFQTFIFDKIFIFFIEFYSHISCAI